MNQFVAIALLLLISCGGTQEPRIERSSDGEILTSYQMVRLTGRRDGDILEATAVFVAPSESLKLEMAFKIGVPTELRSGRYSWIQETSITEGAITARSITFLGGQSDPPSLGGIFELISSGGSVTHRVFIPTSQIKVLSS